MLCWFLPYNNNINPPRFCHFSISWVSSLPFIPGATYLCRLVYCHLWLHGPTLWNQMKFLQLSRWFLAPCLCSCCSPTWNAPLPSFGYFFFKTEVRHYLIHCLPRKKWTEHLLRDTMSGPHLGNHRCSGSSWAGVLMFHMSGQQEGTLEDRGCPPPSGSFPWLLVSGWSKHFSAMPASCSVLCCHGSKPMDWSFFSLSDFPKNGRLLSVFAVSIPSRGRNSVRIFWTRKLREEGQGKVKMWGQNLRSFLPLLLQRHHYQMN